MSLFAPCSHRITWPDRCDECRKPNFTCWAPEVEDEPDAPNVYSRLGADFAAEEYGEQEYPNSDYPGEQTIHVRAADGTVTRWLVCAEPSVSFRARSLP